MKFRVDFSDGDSHEIQADHAQLGEGCVVFTESESVVGVFPVILVRSVYSLPELVTGECCKSCGMFAMHINGCRSVSTGSDSRE